MSRGISKDVYTLIGRLTVFVAARVLRRKARALTVDHLSSSSGEGASRRKLFLVLAVPAAAAGGVLVLRRRAAARAAAAPAWTPPATTPATPAATSVAPEPAPAEDDLAARVAREALAANPEVRVEAEGAVVFLDGEVGDPQTLRALVDAAGRVEGVEAVQSRLKLAG